MADQNASRLVKSAVRSLRILELVHERDGVRQTDVARALGISDSTAHNHLATLEEGEWLVRIDGEYHLGMKLLHFGRSARRRAPYFGTVRRHVLELANQTNLEVEYLVEEYGRLFSVVNLVPETGMHANISDHWEGVGNYYHLSNTASGKAVLAALPDERVDAILDRWGLPAETPYSVTERDELYRQLESFRERGYAEANQELQEGFSNIAVALEDPDGAVFGALSVGWPVYLFDEGDEQEAVELLLEAEAEIETAIADEAEG